MDEAPVRYRLRDLAVVYDGDAEYRAIGEIYNPFGITTWFGREGMSVVFTSKRFLVTGPLVVRAVKLKGYLDPAERKRLFVEDDDDMGGGYRYGSQGVTGGWSSQGAGTGEDDGPGLWPAIRRGIGLLVAGKPLRRVGASLRLVDGGDRFRLERKV